MVTIQSLQEIVGNDRVISEYNSLPEAPEKARVFKPQNNVRRKSILPLIALGTAVVIGGIGIGTGLAKLVSSLPRETSEQIDDRECLCHYKLAIENYSTETHKTGQYDKELSKLKLNKGEIPGMLHDRYVAFSGNSVNARYLDKNEGVSYSDLMNFVQAYSEYRQ